MSGPVLDRRCRLANVQLGADQLKRAGIVLDRVDAVQQGARGAAADLGLAVPDGRQRRSGDGGFLQVVIAGDGDVDARHEAGAGDAVHQADGDQIVPADGGGRLVGQGEELAGCLEAGLLGAGAGNAPFRLGREFRLLHSGEVALIAVAAGRGFVGAADEGDALVAERDQMLGGEPGTEGVIAAKNRKAGARDRA